MINLKKVMSKLEVNKSLRIDKWLWYARFFKSRTLATKLVNSGKLRLDGNLINKSHKQIISGQILTFPYGNEVKVIKVINLGYRRGPAVEAKELFEDLSDIVDKKVKKNDFVFKDVFEKRYFGSGRPTKKDRRLTDKLKTGSFR